MLEFILRRLGFIRVNNMTFLNHQGHAVKARQEKFHKLRYLGDSISPQFWFRNGFWCYDCQKWVMFHDTETDT